MSAKPKITRRGFFLVLDNHHVAQYEDQAAKLADRANASVRTRPILSNAGGSAEDARRRSRIEGSGGGFGGPRGDARGIASHQGTSRSASFRSASRSVVVGVASRQVVGDASAEHEWSGQVRALLEGPGGVLRISRESVRTLPQTSPGVFVRRER
jgi:hypothetical protein